jgi:hypothetical protein
MIISLFVCCNTRDFFLPVLAEFEIAWMSRRISAVDIHDLFASESRGDRYINTHRPIGDNSERLRFDTQAPRHAPCCIQNIIARWQRGAVIAILVRTNSHDFLSFAPAQNDQWKISVTFRCRRRGLRRRIFTVELNWPERNNLQLSLNEPLRRGIT